MAIHDTNWRPGFSTERVEVSIVPPTTIADVLPLVQTTRCQLKARNFPRLAPASPQPLVGDGVFLACPVWSVGVATARRQVCIDCSEIDGRVYAALVPPYLTGGNIPELASLPRNLGCAVYAGPFGDLLQWDSQCHLVDGDTIFVLPDDSAAPRAVPLHVALLGRQHWHRQPKLPEPSCHGTCCVVFGNDNILHINSQGNHRAFREQIANSIGVQPHSLRLDSSRARIWDVAIDGFPCRSVVIASEAGPTSGAAPSWVLVDVRGLFLGWRAISAYERQISCRDILDALLQELGSGWRLWFRNLPQHTDILEVRNGQVFVVEVLHERIVPPHAFPEDPRLIHAAASSDIAPASGGGERTDRGANVDADRSSFQTGEDGAPPNGEAGPEADNSEAPQGTQATGSACSFTEVTFLLLKPNYVHEWVSARLPIGIAVPEALTAAASARHPEASVRMPTLCAVHPQPCTDVALVVCMPFWKSPGSVIAIDSRAVNDKLFAVHIVGTCYRHDFLKLAGLAADAEDEVYFRDLPWPLPDQSPVVPQHGDLVLIRPRTAGAHVVGSLADMLLSNRTWASAGGLPENNSDTAWVLGPEGPFALTVPVSRQHRARHEIASSLGLRVTELRLSPAFGGVSDFLNLGMLLRNVVVARPIVANVESNSTQECVCILDLRPILLGFDWLRCPSGIFLPDQVVARFASRCPRGHCLGRIVSGASFSRLDDPFLIQDGDVVTLAFHSDSTEPIEAATGPQDGPPPSPPGWDDDREYWQSTSGWPDTDALYHAPSAATDIASHTSWESGHPAQHTVSTYESATGATLDRTVMWSGCHATSRLQEDNFLSTPGNQGFHPEQYSTKHSTRTTVSCAASLLLRTGWVAVVVVSYFTFGLTSQCLRHTCCLWPVYYIVFLHGCVSAMPTHTVLDLPSQATGCADEACNGDIRPCTGGFHHSTVLRGIPTPCRNTSVTLSCGAGRGSIRPCRPAARDPLCTLLEQSEEIITGQAYFLASTLVETLVEHFHTGRAAEGPTPISLAAHLPGFVQHDLSQVTLSVGKTFDDVAPFLCGKWVLPEELPLGLRLHPATARALADGKHKERQTRPNLEIYTDGSFSQLLLLAPLVESLKVGVGVLLHCRERKHLLAQKLTLRLRPSVQRFFGPLPGLSPKPTAVSRFGLTL